MVVNNDEEYKYLILTQKIMNEDDESSASAETRSDFNFIILTEPVKTSEINLHNLSFESCIKNKDQHRLAQAQNQITIKFPNILLKLKNKYLLDNVCMLFQSKIIVLFYDCSIFFIDSNNGMILFIKDFSLPEVDADYFLSPTNLQTNQLIKLTPVECCVDAILATSNLKHLNFITFDRSLNKIGKKFRSKNQFESFQTNQSLLCAFDKSKNKILFYELKRANKRSSFGDAFLFEIEKNSLTQPLNFYGFSSLNKYFYLIENNRDLKFYKLSPDKKSCFLIGEIFLYHSVAFVICNEEYICLGMNDRKLVSFLITDRDNIEESFKKIRSLPSRFVNLYHLSLCLRSSIELKFKFFF